MYTTFTRCRADLSARCDEPFANDADDCGGGECTYVLGPPLPISAANNPTCSVNTLSADVTGTVNPDTGGAELNVSLLTLVYLGVGIPRPCPVCVGDTTPFDGILDGTCEGGQNGGLPCDVDGFDATFAPQADGLGLSLDCRPNLGQNVSGAGLVIPLEFTTGHTELAFESNCDAIPMAACACGVCNVTQTQPCRNDTECPGGETCTSKGSGQNRQPNDCSNLVCTDIGDEKGECQAGAPSDSLKFCDGVLRASGEPYVSCDSGGQADCDFTECDLSTPGVDGCGNCTLTKTKTCFLDPIAADGVADVNNPLLVSTFCIPPTISAAINTTGGLPGPARVAADMQVELAY
jgi:hypothetical protein